MEEVLALALESRGSIWHNSFPLCGSDLAAQVGLAGLAEFAFLTFWGTELSLKPLLGQEEGKQLTKVLQHNLPA